MKLVKPMPKPTSKNGNGKKIKKFEFHLNFSPKNLLVWALVLFLGFSFLSSFFHPGLSAEEIDLSKALIDVKDNKVQKIIIDGDRLVLTYKDDKLYSTRKETGESLVKTFETAGIDPKSVEIKVTDQTTLRLITDVFGTVLPLVLMGVFFFYIFRQARGAQDSIFSFGQSRAKVFAKGKQMISFKDVAGVDEAKKELEEVVDFLKHPQKYKLLGARTPKGVLLIGPSGVGKTLLAKAMAGEAGVPFFSMAGSEFMEMLVGIGASRVRDLFLTAKKASPSIIFIDEIDAIGRQRGSGFMGGHDEREQTLNQILVEMDGFTPNDNVIVVAASVTGETLVLVKTDDGCQLVKIGDFIDQYYENDEEGEREVIGVYCLGMEKKSSGGNLTKENLYFGHSAFKKVSNVFRHKVKEIYEIDYLGGSLRATGNHSVFIRSRKGIETKAVSELKTGDILIDLPYKVNRTRKNLMEIRSHQFDSNWSLSLPFFDSTIEEEWCAKYLFATQEKADFSQAQIGYQIGVSQGTVSNWQRGIGQPRKISKNYYKHEFPEELVVTPDLCRILGYYTSEGYARKEVDFCFSIDETEIIQDLTDLIEKIFGILPDKIGHQTHGAVNIVYSAAPLAKFLTKYCGKGAVNKHLPPFLFEAPYEYFLEFLRGVWKGDGYEDKRGKGEITSISKKLIEELNWLCRMHGIKTYIGSFVAKEGRQIEGGKPLAAVQAYRLGWGKTNNPFNQFKVQRTCPVKRAIVKSVKKLPFDGFVYDLCGVENEAFFGGESPALLHNTNRPDMLDSALVRPGRFDRTVALDMPDLAGREAILKIHANGKHLAKDVSWEKIAKRTVGFSGADLENMLNEAAILAARSEKKEIDEKDMEEAAVKVKLGPERKRLQSDEDKKLTAYHEAGHAVVNYFCPHTDPVHRISIVARGMSLGHTLIAPLKDRSHETKTRLLEQVQTMMGGRAAEEMVFSEMTTGAANDISQATRIARAMVINFGMSELGPVFLGPQIDGDETGRSWFEPNNISQEMQSKIDKAIKDITDTAYSAAQLILKENKVKLTKIAKELLEKETLEEEEFERLMG